MTARLVITARQLSTGKAFTALGRDAWAMIELIKAGSVDCTPIDNPGPRWSAYIHALRHECGLDIETRHETHDGLFAGNHARYILRSDVEILSRTTRKRGRHD